MKVRTKVKGGEIYEKCPYCGIWRNKDLAPKCPICFGRGKGNVGKIKKVAKNN
jgi:rubrerythrin